MRFRRSISSEITPARRFRRPRIVLILLAILLSPAAQAQSTDGMHTLNLQDVEVQTLVSTVAEIMGGNFIVDPRISGQVTVISSTPMTTDEVWQTFLSVLEVHGLAAQQDGGVTRIVPGLQALKSGIGANMGDTGLPQEMVTRVLRVSHVPVTEILPLLRPLLPAEGQIIAHEGTNTLLVADRAANVNRIAEVIRRIDQAADQEVEAIALNHANASELAGTLSRLYENAVLIPDVRTNTLLLGGDANQRLKLRTLISHLDTPLDSGGASQVIFLNYANAETLVPILTESLNKGEADSTNPVAIQAHGETNALIITAPPAIFRSLQSVVRQLDIRREQVLVEAIIAEVAVEALNELGIQWQLFDNLGPGGEGVFGGSSFGAGGNNILNLSRGLGGDNPVLPGNGLNLGYISGTTEILGTEVLEIGALLRALASDTDTNVLSTPSVVSLDNSEAEIYVGQEVPFITGQFTNTGLSDQQGVVNPFQTINRSEVGIRLSVTPHINEGDAVVLDIAQEVSAIAPVSGAVDLITNKRTLKTSVMVPDNAILVLGGLITDDLRETVDRVPGLSRIPGIGELFKSRSTQKVQRSLMIFIRPKILKDAATQETLSAGKYNYIRAEQIKARQQSDGLTPEDQQPLLPELSDYLMAPGIEGEVPESVGDGSGGD